MPTNNQGNNTRRHSGHLHVRPGNAANRTQQMHTPNRNNNMGGAPVKTRSDIQIDGAYKNHRLTCYITKLIGCVVEIQVQNGNTYEGILKTFSHQLELVLECAHLLDVKNRDTIPSRETVISKLVVAFDDIVAMSAPDADVKYGEAADGFIDSAIINRSQNGAPVKEKELQAWEPDGEDEGISLESGNRSMGWTAEEMFRTNAEKHGVVSNYDESLHQYTTPLKVENTPEYKERMREATRYAQEIEQDTVSRRNLALENGDGGEDEETRFSAVQRPAQNNDTPRQPERVYSTKRGSPARGRGSTDFGPRMNGRNNTTKQSSKQSSEYLKSFHSKFNMVTQPRQQQTTQEIIKPSTTVQATHSPSTQEKNEKSQKAALEDAAINTQQPSAVSKNDAVVTQSVVKAAAEPMSDSSSVQTDRDKASNSDAAATVVKSTLNPEAKEFVFAPRMNSPSVPGNSVNKSKTATVSVQALPTAQQAMGQPLISPQYMQFPHQMRTLQRVPSHSGQEVIAGQNSMQPHHYVSVMQQFGPPQQIGPHQHPGMPPTPPAQHPQATPPQQAPAQPNMIQTSMHQQYSQHPPSSHYMYHPVATAQPPHGQQQPQSQQPPPPQPSPHPSVSPATAMPSSLPQQGFIPPQQQQFPQHYYHPGPGSMPVAGVPQAANGHHVQYHPAMIMVPPGNVPGQYQQIQTVPPTYMYPHGGHYPPNFQQQPQ